jgi:hypothetical protein
MKHLSSTFLRRGRRERRTGVLTRGVRRAVFGAVALVLAVAVACGLFYGRLASGPLSIHALSSRVGDALAARIGPGWTVALKDSAVQIEEGALALRAVGLEIRDPAGALVVRAPDAVVSVDTLSLLRASFQPRSIEFRDLQLRATLNPDGTLSFAPADDGPPPAPGPEPAAAPPAAAPPGRSAVSATLASLFDALLEPGAS